VPGFEPLAGGFLPRCWTDGRQVLKVWDEGLPASLAVLGDLDLPVVVPEATAVIAGWGVAVFPFVRGRQATGADVPTLAHTMRLMHDHPLVDLPRLPIEESWCLETMRDRLDHPWIRDRRGEVEAQLDRLEGAIERARARPRPDVICHTDFGGHNALVDVTGAVVAILDWDYARLAPREHDLWAAFEEPDPREYLDEYGRDVDLDYAHLEYALLARALRDATARVATERDRTGIDTWGFDRWRRLDRNLGLIRFEL
jgi:aminoglycoside phosphotransferase (APT) family kinase protein